MDHRPFPQTLETSSLEATAAVQFMQHYGLVRAMAVRFAPWPGLVDDVFQQVFLEFMQGVDRWDLEKDLRPLLTEMTRRVGLWYWRQSLKTQSNAMQRLAEHIRSVTETEETGTWEEEADVLRVCLTRLPKESRELLDLYYFQQVPTETIAERLSMKPDTVRRALSRVRDKLRNCVRLSINMNPRHA